jgi:hypothetical protein
MTDYQYPIDQKMPLDALAIQQFLEMDAGQSRPDLHVRFKQQGGKSTGLTMIVDRWFSETAPRTRSYYIIGSSYNIAEKFVQDLNWRFRIENIRPKHEPKQIPPFFKIKEWRLKGGAAGYSFEIKLARRDDDGPDYWNAKAGERSVYL